MCAKWEGSVTSWALLREIRQLVNQDCVVRFQHVYYEANKCADKLAAWQGEEHGRLVEWRWLQQMFSSCFMMISEGLHSLVV